MNEVSEKGFKPRAMNVKGKKMVSSIALAKALNKSHDHIIEIIEGIGDKSCDLVSTYYFCEKGYKKNYYLLCEDELERILKTFYCT